MDQPANRTGGDVYQRVTAEIIRAIESGIAGAYQMPWHQHTALGFPQNALSKRPYHGFNTLALWAASELRGYGVPLWATYRQWAKLGAQVRRGEKATLIVFYKEEMTPSDPTNDSDARKRILVRASYVFNAAQVDGFEVEEPQMEDRTLRLDEADAFITSMGATIRYGGDRAYYQRSTDHIQMPERSCFTGTETSTATEAFYATLFHEYVHWTGHASRLDRDLADRFGSHAYAMEELVAELGAAFLCADLGVANEPRLDHALYVKSWLAVLRETRTALVGAASAATKACRYLAELGAAVRMEA